jgi:hypothetical protein
MTKTIILILQICIWNKSVPLTILIGPDWNPIKRNTHKVATRNHLFTPDLENDQTRVTLQDNPDCNVTPLSGHTTTLNVVAVSPNK